MSNSLEKIEELNLKSIPKDARFIIVETLTGNELDRDEAMVLARRIKKALPEVEIVFVPQEIGIKGLTEDQLLLLGLKILDEEELEDHLRFAVARLLYVVKVLKKDNFVPDEVVNALTFSQQDICEYAEVILSPIREWYNQLCSSTLISISESMDVERRGTMIQYKSCLEEITSILDRLKNL